eukprot:TRINITY_DN956_c0_g1_i1.p1 TRINITY_DN956_c0_g1~~TRINITY_DN956_c0_g1_i1.p1  ORF type:complete len:524 (+),score=145.13 TRINITY_DN956_c0_g1_i1:45-1616(+)
MEGEIKELEQKLAAAIAERDSLRDENKKLQAEIEGPAPRTKFSNRVSIKSIRGREDQGLGLVGRIVTVAGWIKTVRVQGGGKFAFVELNDGSTFGNLQIIVDAVANGFEELKVKASTGCSFWAQGKIVESRGKGQKIELVAQSVEVIGDCDAAVYPLAKGHHPLEFMRTIAHLRPRANTYGAVARVRNALAYATHKFFNERGCLYLHTPVITASDCEGAGEMFQITTLLLQAKKAAEIAQIEGSGGSIDYAQDFFGKPAFLTVSGQLNGEMYACALSSIYTFGPTFRAEDSHTTRHLAEFWMIEPELAFADLVENMEVAEAYLKYCVKYVMDTCPEDMQFFDKQCKEKGLLGRLQQVVDTPFKRVTYTEAVELLLKEVEKGKVFENPVSWGIDLNSEHERYLTEEIFKQPIIVADYPKDIKAFYMRQNDDGKTVAAMDVLVPRVGELMGGSQREERYDVLVKRLKELNLDEESYRYYLDLRRYGSVPHSGFGLGFERLVLFTTGLENIRDAIPFPRFPKHAEF